MGFLVLENTPSVIRPLFCFKVKYFWLSPTCRKKKPNTKSASETATISFAGDDGAETTRAGAIQNNDMQQKSKTTDGTDAGVSQLRSGNVASLNSHVIPYPPCIMR